jgi:DNA polymerase III subunit delta
MASLTLDALLRGLKKGAPDPVYLLHGDEDVLKDEAVRALLDAAVDPTARDFNLDSRFAADLDAETFNALVNTPPMLAERRAVVLRGVDQLGKRKSKLRDELVRYLAAPNPSTVLILVAGAGEDPDAELARQATTVAAPALEPERVPRWVTHQAGKLKLTLAPDAVDLLVAAVGNDLSGLARELEKLASLAGDRPATAADVTALVGVRHGETVHDLVEAALERRAARAAQLVEPVLEQAGMSGVKIVTLLGTHLVGTALARAERERGSGRLEDVVFRHLLAARPYGLRGYKDEAARWARWSALWTAAELSAALRTALAADRALKGTTVSDDRGIVMQLVLGFAAPRREAA